MACTYRVRPGRGTVLLVTVSVHTTTFGLERLERLPRTAGSLLIGYRVVSTSVEWEVAPAVSAYRHLCFRRDPRTGAKLRSLLRHKRMSPLTSIGPDLMT